jgi:PAS domain-containing protein
MEVKKTGKQSAQREYKLKTKTGDYIFIETYSIPLKKNGRLYGILGIAKNITKRKKTAQKLKESAEMFIALFKEGPIPTYTWRKIGDDFILIDFNNAADKITQGHVEAFLGTNASEMYKDRPDILNDLHLCINENTHITREMKYKYNFSKDEKYLLVNYGYVGPDLIIVSTEDRKEKRQERN